MCRVGECYHGAGAMLFTEFYGNSLDQSDGITLKDNPDNHEPQCQAFTGPWIRWAVVRRNAIAGVSEAQRSVNATQPMCGFVNHMSTQHASTDIVVEHNAFACPRYGTLPATNGTGVVFGLCDHCLVRN